MAWKTRENRYHSVARAKGSPNSQAGSTAFASRCYTSPEGICTSRTARTGAQANGRVPFDVQGRDGP